MVKIKVILGSTRPGRFGIQPAQWLMQQTKNIKNAEFELIDVKDLNLPLLNEPHTPMHRNYTKDYTKAWSEIVDEADGFIVVTAEYNHSIPAALKNAFDYLNHEWRYKPVSFVSYGSAAGGSRAVEHLRAVAGELHMYDLREQLVMQDFYFHFDEKGKYKFTEHQAELMQTILKNTVFWAEHLRTGRTVLTLETALVK